jgi:hypothetical protein
MTTLTALALLAISTSGCGCMQALARFDCWKWRSMGIEPCGPACPGPTCCPTAGACSGCSGCSTCGGGAIESTSPGTYYGDPAGPTVSPGTTVQPGPEDYAPEL